VGWHGAFVLALVGLFLISTPAAAITWGQPDTAHPFVGAIVVRWKGTPIEWCSGTLIAPRVFLTAGHCTVALDFYGFGVKDVKISFGPYALDPTTWRSVERWITNPLYNWGPTSDPHDLGVVILKKPVKDVGLGTVAPAGFLDERNAEGLLEDYMFLNVGYGADQNLEPTALRMYSYSEFLSLHDAWLYMQQNIHAGSSGTCYGDSGGPTFYVDPSGQEYVVAVTSWGDAMCRATNINYRTDTAESHVFIDGMLARYGS